MQTKSVLYEVYLWEEDGLTLVLETEDYAAVKSKCEHLTSVGMEYEALKKTTELLDI